MEDNIFGTLMTDELKLVHHRAHRRGLQHNYAMQPMQPQAGQPVTVFARVGQELKLDEVRCYYTKDGSQPSASNGKGLEQSMTPLTLRKVEWDTLCWGYVQVWAAELPALPEGTLVRYSIVGIKDGEFFAGADWPDPKYHQELATQAHFNNRPMPAVQPEPRGVGKTFSYRVGGYAAPQWAREAVIYQIFADRFHPGEGREWAQTANLSDTCGGTLWGIRDRLDYIQDLGATTIWLSPTWPSTSYHGYDVTDYMSTAQALGGDEAMHALIDEAHQRGVKIVLDLVANHSSNEHPYFAEAAAKLDSPYRELFLFDGSEIGYRTFFGVPSMPQINLTNERARKWMFDVARFWLEEFQVDGFRLDHANGPGPEFWAEFQTACKQSNPESFCFGEVVEPPSDFLRYEGRVDGLLDFGFNDAVRRTLGYGTTARESFDIFLERHLEFFQQSSLLLPTFLDNHDMKRFLYIAGHDKQKLREAAELQFRLPSPPVIYYGTEVGMSEAPTTDRKDTLAGSRAPMAWGDDQDKDLLAFYQQLIQQRKVLQAKAV